MHLVDMLQLEQIITDFATAFKNGIFVVNKTRRKFSSIEIDPAHEQNNKCTKAMEVNINIVILDC